MFLGILFVAIGLAILLNALGMFNPAFWGIFWGIFFLAIGIRMMIRRGKCPMCGWKHFMRQHHCDCEDCDHDSDGQDHH